MSLVTLHPPNNDRVERVVIIEPYAGGHRLHYVRLVFEAFEEIGLKPILATTQQTVSSEEFLAHLEPYIERSSLMILDPDTANNRISRIRLQAQWIKTVLAKVQPDKLLIPTGSQLTEGLIYAWTRGSFRKFPVSCEALFLGPGYGYPQPTYRQRLLHNVQMRLERFIPLDSYFHLDSHQLNQVASLETETKRSRFVTMPDPTPDASELSKTDARRNLNIPIDGCYGTVVGDISVAKGVDRLISGFKRNLQKLPANAKLLFTGRFQPRIREALHRSGLGDRVFTIDRVLSSDECTLATAAADFICAIQIGRQGSSGTATRALLAGRPILTGNVGMIPRLVQKYQLGWCADTNSDEQFSETLQNAFDSASNYAPSPAAMSLARFFTEDNFKAHWTLLTRQSLSLPIDVNYQSWSQISSTDFTDQSTSIDEALADA